MAKTNPTFVPPPRSKFMPEPRGWTQEQVAARLGVSVGWLAQNRKTLARLGMPQPDPMLCGRTDSKALETWMDRRAGLVDWGADKSDHDPFAERLAG
jgi:hypothetical protein